jgi:hypothetical protein
MSLTFTTQMPHTTLDSKLSFSINIMPKLLPLSQTNIDAYIYNMPIHIKLSSFHNTVYIVTYKSAYSTQGRLNTQLLLLDLNLGHESMDFKPKSPSQ